MWALAHGSAWAATQGLIKDIKRSSYYEKPSERKRRKERKMIKRAQKAEAAVPYGR